MYSFFFVLILFYRTTSALTYNDKCTKQCDFPGMICINNRCICDPQSRLFWTGARCAPCANDWLMTETICIGYYESKVTWEVAKATCANVKAELISFRNKDIIPLIYNVSSKTPVTHIPATWTSAHAKDLSGKIVYQWLDKSLSSFDENNDWWCRKTTPNLDYGYPYNEPTNYKHNVTKEPEACAAYWRGKSVPRAVCLDDQFCSKTYSFICEKSESTSKQYIGPPPVVNGLPDTSVGNGTTIKNVIKPKPKSNKTIIIIIVLVVVLLLLALLGGICFFLKHRNSPKQIYKITKDKPVEPESKSIESALTIENVIAPIPITVNVPELPEQKNKRGGYSKQQFDEFG